MEIVIVQQRLSDTFKAEREVWMTFKTKCMLNPKNRHCITEEGSAATTNTLKY